MQSEAARRRRALFNRSLTLPSDYLQEEGALSEQLQLLGNPAAIREDSNETSMESENDSSDNQSPQRRPLVAQSKRAKLQRSLTMAAGDNRPLLQKHDHMETRLAGDIHRSTAVPNTLLSKVKERIKQKVIQSTEWPNAAAIVQERRQRALDALEATLSGGHYPGVDIIPLKDMTNRESKRRGRVRSEPVTSTSSSSSAPTPETPSTSSGIKPQRARRSVSETYANPNTFNGIICSNEDLKSILQDYKGPRRNLPKPYKRTQSLDYGRMQAVLAQAQISRESTSSGTSLVSECLDTDQLDGRSSSIKEDEEPEDEGEEMEDPLRTSPASRKGEPPITPAKRQNLTLTLREYSQLTSIDEGMGDIQNKVDKDDEDNLHPAEVVFDEHGQTWDVYGAEFDPEILGIAIQKHLEIMMAPPPIEEVDENGNGDKLSEEEPQEGNSPQDTGFWDKLLCLFRRRRPTTTT